MIVPTHVHTEGIATPASSKASDAAKDNKLNASVASKKQILVPTEAVKRELQQWSARPRTSRSGSKENMHQDVYDRLASNSNRDRFKHLEIKKMHAEQQQCTFTPRISRSQSQGAALRNTEDLYTRLHKEKEVLDQVKKTKKNMYKDKELDGCTFHPITGANHYLQGRKRSSEDLSSRELIVDPCERLYMDHEKKCHTLAKNEVNLAEQIGKACPFKPTVVSKRRLDEIEQNIPIHEKLYAKHSQRQKLLEQKRLELQAEEKRMQRFVSQCKENSNTKKSQPYSSTRSLCADHEEELSPFERLHRLHKEEQKKKTELTQKVFSVILRSRLTTFTIGKRNDIQPTT